MKNGEEIKLELKRLIGAGNYEKASQISRESLKDCQNFIKDFKIGSSYHHQLEKAISDLNSCLTLIANKTKENEDAESNAKQDGVKSEKMYYKTKILSEEVRSTASKIAEADMNFGDFAKTSYGFEKAYASMKKRPDVFFRYLKYLGSTSLCNFYKNSELSYQTLMGILLTLKQNSNDEESVKVVLSYLQDITKTKNFSLIKKFFKKSDKEDLALFFKTLRDTYNHLFSTVELEKLYF
jgi:hypothetical protein